MRHTTTDVIQRDSADIAILRQRPIVFLKTHKTGSSSVANILQRYGISRHLNFALPRKRQGEERYNYIGELGETLKSSDLAPIPAGETYDILCSHVIYSRKAFHEIFPRKSFYFTILREPWSQFVSAINYYGLAEGYIQSFLNRTVANPLSDYLSAPQTFEPPDPDLSFTNNRQLFDLGFPFSSRDPRNESHVKEYIGSLKEDLDFVMITEYFDESLVTLKRHLDLDLKDIMYIPQNTKMIDRNFTLNDTDRTHFYAWYKGDNLLYETFRDIFVQILQNDTSIRDEVKYFRQVMGTVRTYCKDDFNNRNLTVEKSQWNDILVFTEQDCHLMLQDELSILNKFYE